MPGFTPAVGDVLQVRTCCYNTTQIALNILHYRVAAIVNVGLSLQQMAVAFENLVHADYKALMSNQTKWRGCGFLNLSPVRTIEYYSVAQDGVGTTGTTTAPTQTSFIVKLRGITQGRKAIGHYYPGFPSQTYLTATGSMTAAGQTALAVLAAAMGTAVTLVAGANQTLLDQVIRNKDVNVPVPKTPVTNDVFTIAAAPIWATQRRRGLFGRNNLPPF